MRGPGTRPEIEQVCTAATAPSRARTSLLRLRKRHRGTRLGSEDHEGDSGETLLWKKVLSCDDTAVIPRDHYGNEANMIPAAPLRIMTIIHYDGEADHSTAAVLSTVST